MSDGFQVSVPDVPRAGSSTPYMPFKSFANLLDRFDAEGVPGRFDTSYFTQYSGAVTSQMKVTLRALDLMDDERRPTDTLMALVEAHGEERTERLRRVFRDQYSDVLSLPKSATAGQLAEVFRSRGLNGDTVHKATAFFLGLADYLGEEVSPFFKKGRRASVKSGAPRKPRATKPRTADVVSDGPTANPASTAPLTAQNDAKERYLNLLIDMAQRQPEGSDTAEILDRIERVLGLAAPVGPEQ